MLVAYATFTDEKPLQSNCTTWVRWSDCYIYNLRLIKMFSDVCESFGGKKISIDIHLWVTSLEKRLFKQY